MGRCEVHSAGIQVHHQDQARGIRADGEVKVAACVDRSVGVPVKVTVCATGGAINEHRGGAAEGLAEVDLREGGSSVVGTAVAVRFTVVTIDEACATKINELIDVATASLIRSWAGYFGTCETIVPKATKGIALVQRGFADAITCDAACTRCTRANERDGACTRTSGSVPSADADLDGVSS